MKDNVNMISAYHDQTILEFGKHQGKFLYQVPHSYLVWYHKQNIGWWENAKMKMNREEAIISDLPTQYKYLLMEYIENKIEVSC